MPVTVTVNPASMLDSTSISDLNQAVAIWNSTFDTSVTINVRVGFGVDAGTGVTLGNQNISTGGSTNIAYPLPYDQLRTLLINAVPNFFNDTNLPSAPPSDGNGNPVNNFSVTQAQARIFGLPINPNTAAIDGLVSIGTGFTPGAQRIGTILHEIGHALGRFSGSFTDGAGVVWYAEFDLFRFLTNNPSQRYFGGITNPSVPNPVNRAFFSLNGGTTDLGDYGVYSDPSDFLNSGPIPPTNLPAPYSMLTPNDPFDEIIAGNGQFTGVDLLQTEAVGFKLRPPPLPNTRMVFWHDASGANQVWVLNQAETIISGLTLPTTPISFSVAAVGDFNNDGISDLLWRDPSGPTQTWIMGVNAQQAGGAALLSVDASWTQVAVGNFLGAGLGDIVWHNLSGQNVVWNVQNNRVVNGAPLMDTPGVWSLSGVGNFLGNGNRDILWRNTDTGQNLIWNMQGNTFFNGASLPDTPTSWKVAGIGAFGGNGLDDILWHNDATGQNLLWVIQNNRLVNGVDLPTTPTSWQIVGVADFTGSGTDAILWHDAGGANQIWNMQNNQQLSAVNLLPTPVSMSVSGVGVNSVTSGLSGLSTGLNGDPAQLVQAMASFSPSDSNGGAGPISPQTSDQNSQLLASNPLHTV